MFLNRIPILGFLACALSLGVSAQVYAVEPTTKIFPSQTLRLGETYEFYDLFTNNNDYGKGLFDPSIEFIEPADYNI